MNKQEKLQKHFADFIVRHGWHLGPGAGPARFGWATYDHYNHVVDFLGRTYEKALEHIEMSKCECWKTERMCRKCHRHYFGFQNEQLDS